MLQWKFHYFKLDDMGFGLIINPKDPDTKEW